MIFDASFDGRVVRVEVRGERGRYTVTLDQTPVEVDFAETGRGFASLLIEGRSYEVGIKRRGKAYAVLLADDTLEIALSGATSGSSAAPQRREVGPARITAPMPGRIVRLLVETGAQVADGQGIVVMEAMKMENELRSPRAGRVREFVIGEGQVVESGALLAIIE